MRRQTYGYLPSCKASPPIGWYQIILLGVTEEHKCINNLPRDALNSRAAGIRSCDLLIASPARYRYATEPYIANCGPTEIIPLPVMVYSAKRWLVVRHLVSVSQSVHTISGKDLNFVIPTLEKSTPLKCPIHKMSY